MQTFLIKTNITTKLKTAKLQLVFKEMHWEYIENTYKNIVHLKFAN